MSKKASRIRRSVKTRAKIKELGIHRLSVHRTPRHIYAQIISPDSESVVACASSLDKEVKADIKNGGNVDAAIVVGKAIAARSVKSGVESVAFDRSGYKYHGRVKALADAAREAGLKF
ncbi:MAG: 50S ribosomal protein L18 [Gammaproteobacteria bacterium]